MRPISKCWNLGYCIFDIDPLRMKSWDGFTSYRTDNVQSGASYAQFEEALHEVVLSKILVSLARMPSPGGGELIAGR